MALLSCKAYLLTLPKLAVIRLPVVYNNGRLSDGFAELFNLSPKEIESLTRVIESAHDAIGVLAMQNATLVAQGDSLVVSVKPFMGGADVYDRLMESFKQILGAERYGAMVDLHTDELPRAFSEFGAEQRTLTIKRRPGTTSDFEIDDMRRRPSGSTSHTSEVSDASTISHRYRWLIPLFPQVPSLPP
jgi:hypothetical protein